MNKDRDLPTLDATTLALLALMLLVSSWSLLAADWADHLNVVTTVVLLSLVSGTALARSQFSSRISFFFATAYGVFACGWQLAQTLNQGLAWRDRPLELLGRLGASFSLMFRGEVNRDSIVFLLLMAALYWIFGTLAAWTIFRRGGLWAAILPPGIAVLVFDYFYYGEKSLTMFMAAYLYLALILFIRSDVNRRERTWRVLRARVPAGTQARINRVGVVATALLVSISWIGPSFSKYKSFAQLWADVTAPFDSAFDWFDSAFGNLRGTSPGIPEYYGDELKLGAGYMPVDVPVMVAEPAYLPSNYGRFYWRSKVYGRYADANWTVAPTTFRRFDPQTGDLQLPAYDGRETVEVTFTPEIGAFVTVYVPSQPIWVNQLASVGVTRVDGELMDVTRITADSMLMRGEPYQTRASIAVPNGTQLRSAGTDYPAWVLERYLQIPESITPRVHDLALEITHDYDTPYDKAVAITAWLRANIEYSRETEAPPIGVEPIDWFLFDYRIGFCNYYASAEVIMLRSLGIPARLAAGYSRGDYSPETGEYSVTTEDSHSWPEVYFPGYGWVEFEPTVSQFPLIRPEPPSAGESTNSIEGDDAILGRELDPDRLEDLLLEPEAEDSGVSFFDLRNSFLGRMVIGFLVAALLVIIWARVDRSSQMAARRLVVRGLSWFGVKPIAAWMPSQEELTPTGKIYYHWSGWLRRMGARLHAAQTPNERAMAFASLLPASASSGWAIVTAYTQERYGLQGVDAGAVRRTWRRLRSRMLLAWFRRNLAGMRKGVYSKRRNPDDVLSRGNSFSS